MPKAGLVQSTLLDRLCGHENSHCWGTLEAQAAPPIHGLIPMVDIELLDLSSSPNLGQEQPLSGGQGRSFLVNLFVMNVSVYQNKPSLLHILRSGRDVPVSSTSKYVALVVFELRNDHQWIVLTLWHRATFCSWLLGEKANANGQICKQRGAEGRKWVSIMKIVDWKECCADHDHTHGTVAGQLEVQAKK